MVVEFNSIEVTQVSLETHLRHNMEASDVIEEDPLGGHLISVRTHHIISHKFYEKGISEGACMVKIRDEGLEFLIKAVGQRRFVVFIT